MNLAYIMVGPPGCGKTSIAAKLVATWLAKPRGIVLIHDPCRDKAFREMRVHQYADAATWRAAAAASAKAKQPMPRAASLGGSAEDVTKLAYEIGDRNNSADNVRVPILLVFDEGSLRASSGRTWFGAEDNTLLATRRHKGIAPVFNFQQPDQVTRAFFEFCTDVAVFRQTRDRAARLERSLLLEAGELAGAAELERYRYIHVRIGEGIVAEPIA